MSSDHSVHPSPEGAGESTQQPTHEPDERLHFVDTLPISHIAIASQLTSQKRVFEALSQLLSQSDETLDAKTVLSALNTREKLGSTTIGHGIAIPHARLENLSVPVAALLVTKHPIDIDSIDKQPIDIFFALLVPANEQQLHLNWLAKLAHIFQDESMRKTCRTTQEVSRLHAVLAQKFKEAHV